jgi:hypothetical protein
VWQRYLVRKNVTFSSPVPPDLLLVDTAVTIPDLWWKNQEFSLSISSHHGYPFSYISWGMTRWCPQFRGVVSPHRHDHHQPCQNV